MLIIRTMHDLKDIARKLLLPKWLVDHLYEFFLLLFSAYNNDSKIETFTLEGIAEIVILEPIDCLTELRLPMLPGHPKIIELWPEYSRELDIEGNSVYRITFMPDNERMLFVFGFTDEFIQEIRKKMEELFEWSRVKGD